MTPYSGTVRYDADSLTWTDRADVYRASASRDVPVYSPAFADTH